MNGEAASPAIRKRIDMLQHKAVRLTGLLEALGTLQLEGLCDNGRVCIAAVAEDMAQELADALDQLTMPQGTA